MSYTSINALLKHSTSYNHWVPFTRRNRFWQRMGSATSLLYPSVDISQKLGENKPMEVKVELALRTYVPNQFAKKSLAGKEEPNPAFNNKYNKV